MNILCIIIIIVIIIYYNCGVVILYSTAIHTKDRDENKYDNNYFSLLRRAHEAREAPSPPPLH